MPKKPTPHRTGPIDAALPEKVTGDVICRITGYDRSALADLRAKGVIPQTVGRNTYLFEPTLTGMFAEIRGRKTGAARDNRDRREKAEADRAEVEAAKAIGHCISLSDARQCLSEAVLKLRHVMESARFADDGERARVFAEAKAIRVEVG